MFTCSRYVAFSSANTTYSVVFLYEVAAECSISLYKKSNLELLELLKLEKVFIVCELNE